MTDEDDNYDPSDETDAPVSDSNWMRSSDEQVAARANPDGDDGSTGWAPDAAADPSQPQEGQVRTATPPNVPAGYEDAVAEYYRRLGKGQ